jgi:hypothetical protein
MTCEEIQAYFESDPSGAVRLLQESAELSEHATKCPECRGFVEEYRELANYLHAVRESAPEIPASLDAAILAGYETFMAERSHVSVRSRTLAAADSLAGRVGLHSAFGRAAVAAVAVVIACGVMFLFTPGEPRVSHQKFTEQRPVVPPTIAASTTQPRMATQTSASKTPKSLVASAKHVSATRSLALSESSFSSGFQGLMYCDQLSCPDTMDVIRVQLPSPRFSSGPPKASEFVYADVLVGADGIARGIRVVE